MANCGSPIVVNDNGEIEVFDIDYDNATSVDQNILGIKAVVESVLHPATPACVMKRSCEFAVMRSRFLPLDEACDLSPWAKKLSGNMICPYSVIWRAFDLEGLGLSKQA